MDWFPLEDSKIEKIIKTIDYAGQNMSTDELYQRVSNVSCNMEDKVKFILWHWGWNGTSRKEGITMISQIKKLGFAFPPNVQIFLEQMYGLLLPVKKLRKENLQKDVYGGVLRFRYPKIIWKDILIGSECLSVKFDDDILLIGDRLDYNGYSKSGQKINGWEDPNYKSCGAWDYELHLGSSGRVYFWDTEISDCIGIEAHDLLSFFASAFGFILDTEQIYGYTSEEDFELMEQIEKLWNQGLYKQNYFRGRK